VECLNQHWFESIEEARNCIEAWRKEYNQERPHRSLAIRLEVRPWLLSKIIWQRRLKSGLALLR
jgi:transposase InsO family protein